jgi:cystathionine beta-lyase family protein involved in aluminum resistance
LLSIISNKSITVTNAVEYADSKSKEQEKILEPIILHNHLKVAEAFRTHRVSDDCFKGSSGYGYGDYGRDNLDQIYAHIFGAEAALVRPQIVSGTHAISLCLFGILKPGDRVLSVTGQPYDTLLNVIGYPTETPCSLKELGVSYSQIDLKPNNLPDYHQIKKELQKPTKMVLIQRSRGYSWRSSFCISEIEKLIDFIKKNSPETICFVDNCYGEFVEELEPTQVKADLIAGSLIKNPGGGLAPIGGYIAGKEELVERVSYKLTAPGIGAEVASASGTIYRLLYQGLYMAPHIVGEALKGAIFTAALYSHLGYEVSPGIKEKRSDIIQAIKLGSEEKVIGFCKALQLFSPVDSFVIPEAWDMPGYDSKVIMAGGTFVQGSTIELSADAPLRPPYAIYLQGGLSQEYVKLAMIHAAMKLLEEKNV